MTCPFGAYSWTSSCRRVIVLLTEHALHRGHCSLSKPSAFRKPTIFCPQFRQYLNSGCCVIWFMQEYLRFPIDAKVLIYLYSISAVGNSDAEDRLFCIPILYPTATGASRFRLIFCAHASKLLAWVFGYFFDLYKVGGFIVFSAVLTYHPTVCFFEI